MKVRVSILKQALHMQFAIGNQIWTTDKDLNILKTVKIVVK